MKVHPTFNVSELRPVSCSPLCPLSRPLLAAWVVDSAQAYTVPDRIGCHSSFMSFILDPDLTNDFYMRHPDKPGRLPGGVHLGRGLLGTGMACVVVVLSFPFF